MMDDIPGEISFNSTQSGLVTSGTSPASTHEVNVTLIALRLIVCAVGIIGNLLVVFVILVLGEYRKAVTHWYVLQLAIADSMFLLTLPFKVVEDIHNEWIYSNGMCKAKETLLFVNYYSSILFLMVMSIDRYIAVCHNFSTFFQKLRTQKAAFIITVVVWISSVLLCIPLMIYSNKMGIAPNCVCMYNFPPVQKTPEEVCMESGFTSSADLALCLSFQTNKELCQVKDDTTGREWGGSYADSEGYEYDVTTSGYYDTDDLQSNDEVYYEHGCSYIAEGPGWKAFLYFNFIVMFLVPFMIMTVCYTFIVLNLKRSHTKSDCNVGVATTSSTGDSKSKQSRRETKKNRTKSVATKVADRNRNRVTWMCFALVVLFLLCWLPFHSVHLAKMQGMQGTSDFCFEITAATSLIAYINSAINPYLYNFIGTRFGRRFRTAVQSVRASVKKRTPSSVKVHYRPKVRNDGESVSSNITGTTKIYKGKSEIRMSTDDVPSGNDVKQDEHQSLVKAEDATLQ